MAEIIPFPGKQAVTTPCEPTHRIEVFRAQSGNMAPTIDAGDIVEIDRTCSAITNDGIFVFEAAGALAVRRVQRLPGGYARVSSDAAPHVTELVEREAVRVLGRVARIWKPS